MDPLDTTCLLERRFVGRLDVSEVMLNNSPVLQVSGACALSDFEVRNVRISRSGSTVVVEVEIGLVDLQHDRTSSFKVGVPLTDEVTEIHLGRKGDVIWKRGVGAVGP